MPVCLKYTGALGVFNLHICVPANANTLTAWLKVPACWLWLARHIDTALGLPGP